MKTQKEILKKIDKQRNKIITSTEIKKATQEYLKRGGIITKLTFLKDDIISDTNK